MHLRTNVVFYCLAAGIFFPSDLFAKPIEGINPAPSGMVVDLGEVSRYIKVTPEYSRAVLEAVLPYFSKMAKELDLPVPLPITKADVASFHVLPFHELSASMLLKSGWVFNYQFGGRGTEFYSPNSYYSLQDPDKIPDYYGRVDMSRDEAIQLARNTLKKLAIPLKDVFADQEPQVVPPVKIGTNTVPRYEITWIDPYGTKSGNFEINAETKQVEQMILLNRNSPHPSLRIAVAPSPAPPDWPPTNPEYARQLIPMMFKAIDDYAQNLLLPIPCPLTTNNVARVRVTDNGGWPDCDVILTNGWRFVYRHTMVNGYFSPNVLMTDNHFHVLHLKGLEGQWKLTTNQAIELVKMTLAKMNYPTNNIHMDFAPEIHYPPGVFSGIIPHYAFEWDYYRDTAHEDLQSMIEAEVNADNGKLESLYYDDKAYWNSRPPIDVPISTGKYPNFP